MRIIVKWLLINVFWKRQSVITRSFHYVNNFGMSIQDLEWKGWCHSWIDKKEMAMDQVYIGNILKEAMFWMPEKRKRGRLNTDWLSSSEAQKPAQNWARPGQKIVEALCAHCIPWKGQMMITERRFIGMQLWWANSSAIMTAITMYDL